MAPDLRKITVLGCLSKIAQRIKIEQTKLKMALREELLTKVQNQSVEELDHFLLQCKKDNKSIHEILETCSRQQTDELWEGLQSLCSTTLMSIESLHLDEESNETQKLNELVKLLNHVINLMNITIRTAASDHLSIAMIDTALLLHGIMPTLPDTTPSIKNTLSMLFEYWWYKDIKGREEIISNTFDYILSQSLLPGKPMTLIKRLWKLHDYLEIVDVTKETNLKLRGKLLQCFTNYDFYKAPQGVMFLSFLFRLDDNLIPILHTAIKQEIPFAPKALLEKFGEVYFSAWQKSTGETRKIIEDKCIQNLMHQAAVAPRTGDPNMSNILLKVLRYIHNQKDQSGVDLMLHELYSPFLWRYLRAPHSEVRANCASILMDVFPLTTDENEESSDELMQKQYEFLLGLLKDPNHGVRLIAVKGVFNILKICWELLPLTALNGILVVLIKDLSCDSSSDNIRQAVIQGFTSLIDNPLTFPVLQPILPQLKFSIHDSSEKVRIAVMELLLKIKHVRTFKYWTVVPIKHILAHLTITESMPVKRRIMKLMFRSFFPIDQDEDHQVDRLVTLLEMNTDACRHFIKSFPQHMTVAETAKYMITVCRTILTLIKQSEIKDTGGDTDDSNEDSSQKSDSKDKKDEEEDEGLTIKDIPIINGFLESILILWVVTTELFDPANLDLLKDLQRKFRVAVPMMLKAFQEPETIDLVIQIAAYLPSHYVPAISLKCISKLKQMTSAHQPKDFEMFLDAACKWQKVDDIFEIISDWLTGELSGKKTGGDNCDTPEGDAPTIKRSKNKGEKRVMFVEPEQPECQPKIALDYLEYLTSNHTCHMMITNKYCNSLRKLTEILHQYQESGGKVANGDPTAETKNTELIQQAFTLYLKCLVLLHNQENPELNAAKNIQTVISWAEQNLLQNFTATESSNITSCQTNSTTLNNTTKLNTTKRKRALRDLSTFYLQPDGSPDLIAPDTTKDKSADKTVAYGTGANNPELALNMTKILLRICGDVILCGFADVEFCKQVLDLCLQCLETDEDLKLLTPIMMCLYQTTEFYWSIDILDNARHGLQITSIPACMSKLYKTIAFYAKRRPEKCGDVIIDIKKYVVQILSTVIKTMSIDKTISQDLMSTTVAAVVAELSDSSQQFSLGEVRSDLKTLPTLTGWIIEIINAKTLTKQLFLEEIISCIESEAVTDLHPIHGLTHLLATLNKHKLKSSKMEDFLKALEDQIAKLEELKPDLNESEVVELIHAKIQLVKRRIEVEAA